MPADPTQRYVERMASVLTAAGLPRTVALVFTALTADDDGAMTSADLREALGVSAASVSAAVTYLERVRFIHRERERGSRRDVYVVDDDAWHQAIRPDLTYLPMITVLDEALASLPSSAPSRRRLTLMREFLVFCTEELTAMISRWELRRSEVERELER